LIFGETGKLPADEAEAIFATSRMFTDTVRSKNAPTTKYGRQIASL